MILVMFLFLLFFRRVVESCGSVGRPFEHVLLYLILALMFGCGCNVFFCKLRCRSTCIFDFYTERFSCSVFPASFLVSTISIKDLARPLLASACNNRFVVCPACLSLFAGMLK